MIPDELARISGDDVDLKSYRKLAAHGILLRYHRPLSEHARHL
jgi:hypothetical protein